MLAARVSWSRISAVSVPGPAPAAPPGAPPEGPGRIQVPQELFAGARRGVELAEQVPEPGPVLPQDFRPGAGGCTRDQFDQRGLGRQSPFRRHGRRLDAPGQGLKAQAVQDVFHFGGGKTEPLQVPGLDVQPLCLEPEQEQFQLAALLPESRRKITRTHAPPLVAAPPKQCYRSFSQAFS